jgi:hypothetical protein
MLTKCSLKVTCWAFRDSRVTLRLAVYQQSVHLGVNPLETHDQNFFFQLNPCGNSPHKYPLWQGDGFAAYEYAWPFAKCTFCTYSMLLKIRPFALHTIPRVSAGFAEQIVPMLRIFCYNGNLVTWTGVSLTTSKFKSNIFSLSGFTLFYNRNTFILMILYDFCLLPAQFCYIIVYIRKVESCV